MPSLTSKDRKGIILRKKSFFQKQWISEDKTENPRSVFRKGRGPLENKTKLGTLWEDDAILVGTLDFS